MRVERESDFDVVGFIFEQVEAFDRDAGDNGRVEYSLLETASTRGRFRIHPSNGVVYAQQSLFAGQEYSFAVKRDRKKSAGILLCCVDKRQKRNAAAVAVAVAVAAAAR